MKQIIFSFGLSLLAGIGLGVSSPGVFAFLTAFTPWVIIVWLYK